MAELTVLQFRSDGLKHAYILTLNITTWGYDIEHTTVANK